VVSVIIREGRGATYSRSPGRLLSRYINAACQRGPMTVPAAPAPWYFLGMPHRAPGSPGHGPGHYLQGKQIRYYRPAGSADVRQLIEGGFQAFNAGRLSEACHIYADKMLAPPTHPAMGLPVAGALTPAGLGGCVIELME